MHTCTPTDMHKREVCPYDFSVRDCIQAGVETQRRRYGRFFGNFRYGFFFHFLNFQPFSIVLVFQPYLQVVFLAHAWSVLFFILFMNEWLCARVPVRVQCA
jgi:hypothetical protein